MCCAGGGQGVNPPPSMVTVGLMGRSGAGVPPDPCGRCGIGVLLRDVPWQVSDGWEGNDAEIEANFSCPGPSHQRPMAIIRHRVLRLSYFNLFNIGQVIGVCSHDVLGAGSGPLVSYLSPSWAGS